MGKRMFEVDYVLRNRSIMINLKFVGFIMISNYLILVSLSLTENFDDNHY